MIIADNAFVYIHHPKTGGTFVTEMLRQVAAQSSQLRIDEPSGLKHSGVKKIPDEFRKLQIVTNVRNLFEHYVSRYTFRWWADPTHSKQMFHLDEVKKDFPKFPDLSFSEFLRLFNHWPYRRTISSKLAQKLTDQNIGYNSWVLMRLTLNEPSKLPRKLDSMDDKRLAAKFNKIRFLHTETLNTDLCQLLRDYGVDEQYLAPILASAPILPKKGGRGAGKQTWRQYFNDADVAYVSEKDRMYFRLFPGMDPANNAEPTEPASAE